MRTAQEQIVCDRGQSGSRLSQILGGFWVL